MGDGRQTNQTRQAERLLLQLASFGNEVTAAMARATGTPDVVANTPLLVLCLLDLDGPARPSVISGVVGLTTGGTTKLLDRLEDAGLVQRSYGAIENDHRGVEVSLTTQGRRTLRAATAALVEHLPEVSELVKSVVTSLEALSSD